MNPPGNPLQGAVFFATYELMKRAVEAAAVKPPHGVGGAVPPGARRPRAGSADGSEGEATIDTEA